jgi:hypothetical protein
MISEISLSRGYSSFWSEVIPWINPFTQVINKRYMTFLMQPIKEQENPAFRSINSIVAFNLYRNRCNKIKLNAKLSFEKSIDEIKKYPRNSLGKYKLDTLNKCIIDQIADRLHMFYSDDIIIDPYFPGCGMLANCRGDILHENDLVEVKTGERALLATDIKQLLIYCGLNEIAGRLYPIKRITYFNPRMGVTWSSDIDLLFKSISTLSIVDFYQELENILLSLSAESIGI